MVLVGKSIPVTIIFDVDGILVDNVQFEEEVTTYIIRRLAEKKKIGMEQARQRWFATLEGHRDHPEWHDYALHCRTLGIGDVWRHAHESCRKMLKKFPGVDQAIDIARQGGRCWVASDATRWVVDFKLAEVDLKRHFDEVVTASRWTLNKGEKEYWEKLARLLPKEDSPLLFIENRYDRISAALDVLRQCVCVWVRTPDHTEKMGFRSRSKCSYNEEKSVVVSTHESLASTIGELLSEEAKRMRRAN